MTEEAAKYTDYRKNEMDSTFSRLIINVRVKAGQVLQARIRAHRCSIDWGDGVLQNNFTHQYAEGGFQRILIIGSRINWLNMDHWGALQIYIIRCPFLARLYCQGNRLTKLNLINCPSLVYLDCSHNRLNHIQISELKLLKEVKANDNHLKIVDFSGCSQLQQVDLTNNNSFMAITQGCQKLKNLQFDEVKFNSEDYKRTSDDFPAVIMNGDNSLIIKGNRELTERS